MLFLILEGGDFGGCDLVGRVLEGVFFPAVADEVGDPADPDEDDDPDEEDAPDEDDPDEDDDPDEEDDDGDPIRLIPGIS